MATIASLNVSLTGDSAQLRRELDRTSARTRRFARTQQSLFTRLGRGINTLRFAFAGFAAFAAGGALSRIGDEFISINNLLRASGLEGQNLENAFMQVQRVAENTRGSLETTARLFATINRNSQQLGATQDQILTVITAIQQAFALSGASVAEAAGATRQLSQALASGQLRGEELNSVLENAPLIAQAIATNLGVTLGQLRMLAAEGQVTSTVVFQALLNEAGNLNQAFQDTNLTFGQSLTIIRTRLTPVIGRLAERILPAFANVLEVVARVVETLVPNIRIFTGILTGVLLIGLGRLVSRGFGGLIRAIGVINTSITRDLRSAFRNHITLIMQYTGATVASAAAIARQDIAFRRFGITLRGTGVAFRIAAFGARTFSIALAALGGPIGLAVQAITTLAIVFSDELVAALRVAANFFIRAINFIISGLDRVLRFFGRDGITFRLQEFMDTVMESAESTMELVNNFGALAMAAEEARQPVDRFQETLTEAMRITDRINELGSQAFDRLADSLTDFVTTGRFQIRDFVRFVITEFIRIQIRSALARSLAGSSLFGGFRQAGGPVNTGQAFIVGESGPELFVPNTNGNIVPNNRLARAEGGQGATQVTYNINAVDARSFRDLVARDPEYIYNVAERGRRRRGV